MIEDMGLFRTDDANANLKRAQEALKIAITRHLLVFHRLTGQSIERIELEHLWDADGKIVDYIVTPVIKPE